MKLFSISVFDLATSTYARPFFVAHPGQAVRSFIDEVKNPESELGKHPTDYELWQTATFDDSNGTYAGEPLRLLRGADI